MRYLQYSRSLVPFTTEEELPDEEGVIVAVRGSKSSIPGVQYSTWFLSDPWRGHTQLLFGYEYSKCKAEIFAGGEVLEVLRSHSPEEAVAQLGFRVLLDEV